MPPGMVLPRSVPVPGQREVTPVIAGGTGSTVMVALVLQPVLLNVYEMTTLPADIPVTTPLAEPMVATAGVAELHTPPGVALISGVVAPEHTLERPFIARGVILTITMADRAQPVANVYTIVAVPAPMPETRPDVAFTVATVGARLLQVPPVDVQARAVVRPVQTARAPVMVAGSGLTVMVVVALQLVGSV